MSLEKEYQSFSYPPNPITKIEESNMPNTNLLRLRHDLGEFIFDLIIGAREIKQPFAHKLQALLTAYKDEINRQLSGASASPEHHERVTVAYLMSGLLISQFAARYHAKRLRGIIRSKADAVTVLRLLLSASSDLEIACAAMAEQLPNPRQRLLAKPEKSIWLHFYNTTADEAQQDADTIRALFAANEERAQEQIA